MLRLGRSASVSGLGGVFQSYPIGCSAWSAPQNRARVETCVLIVPNWPRRTWYADRFPISLYKKSAPLPEFGDRLGFLLLGSADRESLLSPGFNRLGHLDLLRHLEIDFPKSTKVEDIPVLGIRTNQRKLSSGVFNNIKILTQGA